MRVSEEALDGRRQSTVTRIVAAVRRELETRHGAGFGEKSLRHMLRLAEVFRSFRTLVVDVIVSALRRQLLWSISSSSYTLREQSSYCRQAHLYRRELAEQTLQGCMILVKQSLG